MSANSVSELANPVTHRISQAAIEGVPVVFPSELAADYWRRYLLLTGVLTAVREDQFLSWDRFKEQAFELRTERLPVNTVWRELFVRQILRENAESTFLRWIVRPEHAGNAGGFARLIGRTLPALRAFEAVDPHESAASWLTGLKTDLSHISHRYTHFLDEYGLYEPRWLATAPAFTGGDYLLVMPELAEDWPEFAGALAACPVVPVPAASPPPMDWFRNSRLELREVMLGIGALLDAGTPADQIVLTVCELDELRPRIEEMARRLSVPVSFAAGVPLTRSAAGRLLRAMQEVVQSGFSAEALKSLLLAPAVPWRAYGANAEAVLNGIRVGAIGGSERCDERWRRIPPGPSRDLIDLLRRALPGIVNAPNARELRLRYLRFASEVFDSDSWNPDDERVLQRAVEELRTLARLEQEHGITVPDPFRFWLERLETTSYVPAGRERGVTVAPYRVGAAMYPAHHFVMNAHNGGVSVRVDPFPFLSEAQREQIGDQLGGRELSELFVRAYAVSGAAVHISGSRETFGGPVLPPGPFVIHDAIQSAEPHHHDLWEQELNWDAAAEKLPAYALQRDGAAAYAEAEGRTGPDYTVHEIDDSQLRDLLLDAQRPEGQAQMLLFSSRSLETYFSCPFGYLLERPLKLSEFDFSIDPDSPRETGTLYHDTLERFFAELGEQGRRFEAERLAEYQQRVHDLLQERLAQMHGMIPAEAHAARVELYRRVLDRVLQLDTRVMNGHLPQYVEAWERTTIEAEQVVLVGRIDRVSRAENGTLTLVDYKKGKAPARRAVNAGSETPTGVAQLPYDQRIEEALALESVQVALYLMLLQAHGERVTTAAFVSLEKQGLIPVICDPDDPVEGKPMMSRERMTEVQQLLRDRIRLMAASLRAGDYRCGERCHSCPFRGVCRAGFVVR